MTVSAPPDLVARTAYAAGEAARHAAAVDASAAFPDAALDALRAQGLLAAWVSRRHGGEGASVAAAAASALELGRACSSTGMVFALHQAAVLTLARHGQGGAATGVLQGVVVSGGLLSTAPVDGHGAPCTVAHHGEGLHLEVAGVVVPFGEHAGAVLIHGAPVGGDDAGDLPRDVLVVCTAPSLALTALPAPPPLGLRGAHLAPCDVTADVGADAVLGSDASGPAWRTATTLRSVLVAAALTGIGAAAAARARAREDSESARRRSAASLGPLRGRELDAVRRQATSTVTAAAERVDRELAADAGALSSELAASATDTLAAAVRGATDMARRASSLCGIAGYKEDSPGGVGRLVRDAWGGCLFGPLVEDEVPA